MLVTGASGRLGARVVEAAVERGWQVTAWSGRLQGQVAGVELEPVELTDFPDVSVYDAVIHTAALAAVAECWRDPERAHRINAHVPGALARSARRLIHVSTDMVFDGQRAPYREDDVPAPLSVYGHSKRAGELEVLEVPRHLVMRVALLHGPAFFQPGFYEQQLDALRERRPLKLFTDEWRTPITYVEAARTLVAMAGHCVTGVLHLGGPERLSRYEFGLRLAREHGLDPSVLEPVTRADVPAQEPRARDLSLDSTRLRGLTGIA